MAFAESIMRRHFKAPERSFWESLVYRRKEKTAANINVYKNFRSRLESFIDRSLKQYEKKYYSTVTNLDSRRLLRTMEVIYGQPGEKKQLVYLLNKFGIMTGIRKEWQENATRLKRYEEELEVLRRQVRLQEEYLGKMKNTSGELPTVSDITFEVMRSLKKELRRERFRREAD